MTTETFNRPKNILMGQTADLGGMIISREKWDSLPTEAVTGFRYPERATGLYEVLIAKSLLGTSVGEEWDHALFAVRQPELENYAGAAEHLLRRGRPGGCWQCGEDEDPADTCTLAIGAFMGDSRWLCRNCMETRSDEAMMALFNRAMFFASQEEEARAERNIPAGGEPHYGLALYLNFGRGETETFEPETDYVQVKGTVTHVEPSRPYWPEEYPELMEVNFQVDGAGETRDFHHVYDAGTTAPPDIRVGSTVTVEFGDHPEDEPPYLAYRIET